MVKLKKKKLLIGIIIVVISLFSIVVAYNFSDGFGSRPLAITSGATIEYRIPHMVSYRCEPVEDKYGISITIPDGGALLSKETIGFHTNGISNIQVVSQGSWIKTRIRYFVCDSRGFNCGSEKILSTQTEGAYTLSISSLDFESDTLKIYSEKVGVPDFWNWYYWGGNSVTFDGKVFGLRLYSTTRDPAGAKICTTSCNLDCPDIGYREKLLFTDKTQLGFYKTAPYLEYWETINYDINAQGGATIYNPSTNKFCFAGAVYTGDELTMDNGITYVYPDTNTRQNKLCCPGATISSTYSDLVCQDDYTWKVIEDTDKLTCISDYNCPGQGGETCQNRILIGYHCQNKDENGVGVCIKETGTIVECCVNGDCARDQVCDIYTHTCKGGTILPVCGDGKLDAGEQCDDGNTISGDGCTSTCEIEVEHCVEHPEDPICQKGICEDCDAYARSLIFGKIFESQSCSKKFFQNSVFCIFSFLKLFAIPLIFIFSLIFGFQIFNKILRGQYVWLSWVIGVILSLLIAWLTYFLFFLGVIIFIIYIVFRIIVNFIPGLKVIRRKR